MDINISSRGGNYSAVNGFAPPRRKMKGFGNYADSNIMAIGKPTTKKQMQKKKKMSKGRPLKYKQNLGQS